MGHRVQRVNNVTEFTCKNAATSDRSTARDITLPDCSRVFQVINVIVLCDHYNHSCLGLKTPKSQDMQKWSYLCRNNSKSSAVKCYGFGEGCRSVRKIHYPIFMQSLTAIYNNYSPLQELRPRNQYPFSLALKIQISLLLSCSYICIMYRFILFHLLLHSSWITEVSLRYPGCLINRIALP